MRIAILISGRGSNMDALITAAETAHVEIALIASNKPCSGLERAAAAVLDDIVDGDVEGMIAFRPPDLVRRTWENARAI